MIWVAYAVVAHVANSLVFIADKTLVGSQSIVGSPARFAALSGLVAAGAGVILPFVFVVPTAPVVGWSLAGGAAWVVALWLFFDALKYGEPSRVVPIAGSAVPLFTLLIATGLLGDDLSRQQLWAVVVLVLGGAALSISVRGIGGLSRRVVLVALASGAAFATHFALVDLIYANFDSFLAGFAYARIGVGVVSLLLLVPLWVGGLTGSTRQQAPQQQQKKDSGVFVWSIFWGSKALGTGALVLQNYAISLGSVTVVNALQGTQYLFLLLFSAAVSAWWPQLFREELGRVALVQKIFGIVLVGVGLVLLIQ